MTSTHRSPEPPCEPTDDPHGEAIAASRHRINTIVALVIACTLPLRTIFWLGNGYEFEGRLCLVPIPLLLAVPLLHRHGHHTIARTVPFWAGMGVVGYFIGSYGPGSGLEVYLLGLAAYPTLVFAASEWPMIALTSGLAFAVLVLGWMEWLPIDRVDYSEAIRQQTIVATLFFIGCCYVVGVIAYLRASVRQAREINQTVADSRAKTEALEKARRDLITMARQAGMAEVATNVLHNVGNLLHSINTSTYVASNVSRNLVPAGMGDAVDRLKAESDVGEFLKDRGDTFVGLLDRWHTEQQEASEALQAELGRVQTNLEHIKRVISTQQTLATGIAMVEGFETQDMIDLLVDHVSSRLERHRVTLELDLKNAPRTLYHDRATLAQILVNLVSNGVDAIVATGQDEGRIDLTVAADAATGGVTFTVQDNGVGIAPEHLSKLFQRGFTTKQDGHGIGLHASALQAETLGGELSATSEGQGHGARFVLTAPLTDPRYADLHPARASDADSAPPDVAAA